MAKERLTQSPGQRRYIKMKGLILSAIALALVGFSAPAHACVSVPTAGYVGAPCFATHGPTPPTLTSPVDPFTYNGADNTGATDASAKFNAALQAGHDIDITTAGTYLFTPGSVTSHHGLILPANRIIECAAGVNITIVQTADETYGDYGMIETPNGGNYVIGCTFKGGNHSNTGNVALKQDNNEGQFIILVNGHNVTLEGDTFQYPLGNSAVQVNSDFTGVAPKNFVSQWNNYSHIPNYGLNFANTDPSNPAISQHELSHDGNIGVEDDDCSSNSGVKNVVIQNDAVETQYGNCGKAGDPLCSASYGPDLDGGENDSCDYHTNTVQNNYCLGNTVQAADVLDTGVPSADQPTYTNDYLDAHCTCKSGASSC
jgi:hypothetical protein